MSTAHPQSPSARQVAQAITDGILSGRYQANEKLPPERALANELGVSRPVVREALRSVEQLGLIETRAARGTWVQGIGSSTGHRGISLSIRRRGVTAQELSEARIAIESVVAGEAARSATASDIKRLGETLVVLEKSTGMEHVRWDLRFHLTIAAAANNPVLEIMLESIAPLTAALMTRSTMDPDVMRLSQPLHRVAFEAIRDGDAEGASAAIRTHLGYAKELYGDDYTRSVDSLAQEALTQAGYPGSFDDLVSLVLRVAAPALDSIEFDGLPNPELSSEGQT
jgi:GntR family transcriptional regulator, transcriptional repressor for pyruvate dehydrogenase complex